MILQQRYPLPAKEDLIPLSDGAGEVVAVGNEVKRFKVGDRVIGSYFARWRDGRLTFDLVDQLGCTLDGMLTEYALLDEHWVVRVPDHLTWEEAATLPCAGVTAWNSVIETGAVTAGQTVLTLGTGGCPFSPFSLRDDRLSRDSDHFARSQDRKVEGTRRRSRDQSGHESAMGKTRP